MEEEFHAMIETFPSPHHGHIFKFLQGFAVTEKALQQFEDETSDLDDETVNVYKKFLKKTRSLCFDSDTSLDQLHSRVLFFLQKLSELRDLGFPVRTERRQYLALQMCLFVDVSEKWSH